MAHEAATNPKHAGPIDTVVESEHETQHGWVYEISLSWKSQGVTQHQVRLAWVDHDALCGGAHPPSDVAKRAATIAAQALGHAELPSKFDVSTLRRLIPGFERLISPTIG